MVAGIVAPDRRRGRSRSSRSAPARPSGFFLGTASPASASAAASRAASARSMPLVAAHERAGVLSLLYVVSYLGLGVPAVLAGFLVVHAGGLLDDGPRVRRRGDGAGRARPRRHCSAAGARRSGSRRRAPARWKSGGGHGSHDRARDRLLAAANDLFYREGVHTVGIDRVIEQAGVAKASLYNTFGSKDELIRAYLEAPARGDRRADGVGRWPRTTAAGQAAGRLRHTRPTSTAGPTTAAARSWPPARRRSPGSAVARGRRRLPGLATRRCSPSWPRRPARPTPPRWPRSSTCSTTASASRPGSTATRPPRWRPKAAAAALIEEALPAAREHLGGLGAVLERLQVEHHHRSRLVRIQPAVRSTPSALLTASRDAPIQPGQLVLRQRQRDPHARRSVPAAPNRSASSTSRAATRPVVSCAPNSIRLRSASRSRSASSRISRNATRPCACRYDLEVRPAA